MDGRKNNGGARKGAGRKPKSDEIKLIERLDNIIDQDKVIEVLRDKAYKGDMKAITLYMNYRNGKPKETVDLSATGNVEFKLTDIVQFGDSKS